MKKTFLILACIFVVLSGFIVIRYQNQSDCTSVESYDFIRDECYFDCSDDTECNKLTKQRDAELDAAFSQSKSKLAEAKPESGQVLNTTNGALYNRQTTGSETSGAIYTVTPSGLKPAPQKEHKDLWELTNRLIGKDTIKNQLLSFEVFDDNKNDTGASVWRSNDPYKWHMSINQAYADNKRDLIRTIVHEYGHILTLSGNQVETIEGACPRLQLSEGCGRTASYINSFDQRFWKNYGFESSQAGELSEQDAADLYANEPESFVSEYASTNITEDVAESFADFVLKTKPNSNIVKEQKVKFFYSYPELVSLRDNIRAAAAKEIL